MGGVDIIGLKDVEQHFEPIWNGVTNGSFNSTRFEQIALRLTFPKFWKVVYDTDATTRDFRSLTCWLSFNFSCFSQNLIEPALLEVVNVKCWQGSFRMISSLVLPIKDSSQEVKIFIWSFKLKQLISIFYFPYYTER